MLFNLNYIFIRVTSAVMLPQSFVGHPSQALPAVGVSFLRTVQAIRQSVRTKKNSQSGGIQKVCLRKFYPHTARPKLLKLNSTFNPMCAYSLTSRV